MRPRKSPNGYYRRPKKRTKKHEREPGTHAEWAMVNLTKWIAGLSVVTAFIAIVATSFTGLQWWEAHVGGGVADKQAEASVRLASAAAKQVEIARQQTAIARDGISLSRESVQGTLKVAQAASAQAEANQTQANTAVQQLKLSQVPNIDILVAEIRPYDSSTIYSVRFAIKNAGTYTVENAVIYAATAFLPVAEIPKIWSVMERATQADLVPGVDHTQYVHHLPINEQGWNLLVNRQLAMVHAVRMEFKDAGGRKRIITRCIYYNGSFDAIRSANCADI